MFHFSSVALELPSTMRSAQEASLNDAISHYKQTPSIPKGGKAQKLLSARIGCH
jgi:hypothetical protein